MLSLKPLRNVMEDITNRFLISSSLTVKRWVVGASADVVAHLLGLTDSIDAVPSAVLLQ